MARFDWFWKREKKEDIKTRSYKGAIHDRLSADWVTSGTSADSEIIAALKPLRNRSRDLCRNNDYAKGAVRTIVNNVIGKGVTLQSQVKRQRASDYDDRINTLIEEAWLDWGKAKYCHTAGKLGFTDIERLIVRSLVESGEVLVRIVRKTFGGSPVPICLEVIESDQLCDDHSLGYYGQNVIRLGVEVNEWQRPQAYWLYPNHPGDYQFSQSYVGGRLIRVPADEIIHLFLCDRPGQTRGIPWFHAALMRLRHVGGYEESQLVAARAQAGIMGFIQTSDGDLLSQGVDNNQRQKFLSPGTIEVLSPGETFQGFAPTRPDTGFDPFIRMMLRGVAASLGLSYESLSRDYSNTSYSSARTSVQEERDNYKIVQDWLISNFHQKVFEVWLEAAVMSGSLSLPKYEVMPSFYHRQKWTPRGWQWVDPQNEVAANKEAIKAGFTSLSQVVAQTGGDVEDVLMARKRELDLAKSLGINFDTTIADTSPQDQGGGEPPANNQNDQTATAAIADGLTPARKLSILAYREKKQGLINLLVRATDEELQPFDGFPLIPYSERKGQSKTCTIGISCGGGCISKAKVCRKTLDATQKGKKAKLAKRPLIYKATPKAGTLAEIDPSEVLADPKRFQYKILGEHTASGSVGSLSGVRKYDPNLAGIIQVWEDPADGKTYVVNGHNRLELAKRLGADKVAVRYLDVKDDREARAVGAVTNIAEGRGNALDAAKFFKDTGLSRSDLDKKGIPMREAIAQDGLALSQLEDSLFRKAIQGDITVRQGAIIGGAGLSETNQLALWNLAEKESKRRNLSDSFLTELADTVKNSSESLSIQFDLFGGQEIIGSNAIEKAHLQSQIKKRLSREKRLFGLVAKSKAANELMKAGNLINQGASKEISKEAASTLQIFDHLKNVSGPISKALNQGADRILKGESPKKVEDDVFEEMKKLVESEIK